MRSVLRFTVIVALVGALSSCSTVGPDEAGHEYVLVLEAPAGIAIAGSLSVYSTFGGDAGVSHALLEIHGSTEEEPITWNATEIARAGVPADRTVRVIGLQLEQLTRFGGTGTVRLLGMVDGVVEIERTMTAENEVVSDLVLGSVPAGF